VGQNSVGADNAMSESFFAGLEGELIERSTFQSKAQARRAVFTWIEGWYNPRRRHIGLGYLSPLNFEGATKSRRHSRRFENQTGSRPPKWVNTNSNVNH
jgi:putative transposase